MNCLKVWSLTEHQETGHHFHYKEVNYYQIKKLIVIKNQTDVTWFQIFPAEVFLI